MGGVEIQLHSFITSVINESKWLAPTSDRFTSEKKPPMTLNKRLGEPQRPPDASEEKPNVCQVSIVTTERTNMPELMCSAEIFYLVLLA